MIFQIKYRFFLIKKEKNIKLNFLKYLATIYPNLW